MALPKINSSPKYEMVIPSTNETVRFRPFLVKEEKVLMIAMESNENSQMLGAIVDTLDSCIEGGVKRDSLTTFDVEYMFTKLRAKSVGETSKVGVNCEHCELQNEVVINIDDLKVEVVEPNFIIELDSNISIEMKWPTYSTIVKMNPESNATDQVFAVLRASLSAVHTSEERIDLKDESEKEIHEFIESMDRGQFEKIQQFIEQMPNLSHNVNFKCQHCNEENNIKLEGMQSFF